MHQQNTFDYGSFNVNRTKALHRQYSTMCCAFIIKVIELLLSGNIQRSYLCTLKSHRNSL